MLGKLLKYDFRALSRTMIPLQASILIAGIVGAFAMNFSVRSLSSQVFSSDYSASDMSPLLTMLNIFSSMLGMFVFALVFASVWVTLFLIAHHLYKSFLGDGGYLAFTLPVTPSQHLWSKIIAGLIWLLINTLVVVVVTTFFLLIGFSTEGLVNNDVLMGMRELVKSIFTPLGALFTLELLLFVTIGGFASLMQIYTSIILGGTLARTHKILAAVGIYVAISFVVNSIISIVSAVTLALTSSSSMSTYNNSYMNLGDSSWFFSIQPFMWCMIVCYVVFSLILYFMGKSSLKNNLNLD